MTHGKTEEVRIVVAFGDIWGFSDTSERVTSATKELVPFFNRFDAIIAKAERKTGFLFNDTGDGFMCLIDLLPGHNCDRALHLLNTLWKLIEDIHDAMEAMPPPRFLGFRVRIAAGYVLRKRHNDGKTTYRGKPINLAHNLLEISKQSWMIGHESFKALMTMDQIGKAGFVAVPLLPPLFRPESVNDKDARSLWIFEKVKKRL